MGLCIANFFSLSLSREHAFKLRIGGTSLMITERDSPRNRD